MAVLAAAFGFSARRVSRIEATTQRLSRVRVVCADALRRRDSDRLPRSRKSCSNPLEKNQVGKEEVSCRSLLFLGGVSLLALIAFVFGFLQIFVYTRRRCSSLRSLNLHRSLRLTPGSSKVALPTKKEGRLPGVR